MLGRKVLISGCNGALGHAMSRTFLKSGAVVTGLVRPGRTLPEGVARLEVAAYMDDALSAPGLQDHHDIVIHLAAYGVKPGDRDPAMMDAVNVSGTLALIRHAARIGAKRILIAGSCAEYADDAPLPLKANAPEQTKRLYGASKARATHEGLALAARIGIETDVLRIFNVYGPNEAPHRLLQSLVGRLRTGERVALSHGMQIRDFILGEDVAGAFLAAADKSATGIIDICTGTGTTVRTFAETVAAEMGADPALLGFGDIAMRPDDIAAIVGDPTSMKDKLGYRPRFTVETGIRYALGHMA